MKKKQLWAFVLLLFAISVSSQANAQSRIIVNNGETKTISSETVTGVISNENGGAIYNQGNLDVISSEISGNKSSNLAGAIYNTGGGILDLNNVNVSNNEALCGGAIYAGTASGDVNISNSIFESNKASDIGAIGSFSKTGTMTIDNTVFKNNTTTGATAGYNDGGGALFVGAESATVVKNSTFDGNSSAGVGGAIATRDITKGNNVNGKLDIENTSFTNNTSKGDGGAIYNAFYNSTAVPNNVSLKGVTFEGNSSEGNGGAIYNAAADMGGNVSSAAIEDTSFINNSATGNGGAIFSNGTVNILANNSDVIFSGNSATDGGDIYMAAVNSNLNINANSDKTVTFASGVSGIDSGYNMSMTGGGTLDVQSAIKNASLTVDNSILHLNTGSDISSIQSITLNNNSTLNTVNNQIDNFASGIINTDGSTITVVADVDMSSGKGDNIGSALSGTTSQIIIDEINGLGNTTASNVSVDLYSALGLNSSSATISTQGTVVNDVMTPIRKLTGSVSQTGILNYNPTGNSYNDFNSAIMVSTVASQVGGYLNQLNSYDQAFTNMDMYMNLPYAQRQALKNINKYAAGDSSYVFDPVQTEYSGAAGWLRAYGTFESVGMHDGPDVSNVSYGTYAGLDSQIFELKNGWDAMLSVYAAYNGSHQAFQGNSIYQNGGTFGLTGTAYKGNFFTALTANVGANVADADTMYGSEDFTMLMTGVASKTGYNFEFKDGKFILQPSFMFAYSMVNTFDYTNAAGVRINSDALHAFTFEPGVKFISNLQNGWQPYAGVSVVMNALNDANFKANDVSLPELSIKPYAKYGVGVKKTWGEKFTGFFQAFVTSGGRNGIGFQGGLRWKLGKAPVKTSMATERKYIKTSK